MKYLLWNIYGKNLIGPLIQVIIENEIDVVALIETKKIELDTVINQLNLKGCRWKKLEFCPNADIRLIVKDEINVSIHCEEKHYNTYKIKQNEELLLLTVVHLSSAMYKSEEARSSRAEDVSNVIRKIEEELFGENEYKSIVIGDFNLQPYSRGIIGAYGFNATMSIIKAKKVSWTVDGEKKLFYFNPTWKIMGDNKNVQGSYYNNSDQDDKAIFWYSFDEVLIRPSLIDRFIWNNFVIIEETKDHKFIRNEIIDKNNYSDHLPVKFEII